MHCSMESKPSLSATGLLLACLAMSSLVSQAQISIKSEDVSARFGVQAQMWANWAQDPKGTAPGYTQNLFLRRLRLMASGEIGKDLTFFIQTDSPNLGRTPKTPGAGFMLQDAFMEWKPSNALRVDGGLFLVPLSRNALQSTASYYGVDLSPLTTIANSATQSTALRDLGFGVRGFLHRNKVQYRCGMFQGQRDPDGRNSLRASGYLQYDFRDTELGYTFVGTALGKQRILAIDAGFDAQGSYRARSASIAVDQPIFGGDEIGGQFQFFHYDGGTKFTAIPPQNDWFAEWAYYIHQFKLQPFGKIEAQGFATPANAVNNIRRVGGGVNFYIHGQNLKLTMQFMKVLPPSGSPLHQSNEAILQLQVFYF